MENTAIVAKKVDKNKVIFVISAIIVPLLAFLVFYVYINFSSIVMAFQRYVKVGNKTEYYFTLENFKMFFDDISSGTNSELLLCLRNTFIFFFVDNFIRMPLSLVICYFVYKKIFLGKAFRAIIYMPNIITGTIFAALYKYIVGPGGPLFAIWDALGQQELFLFADPDYALTALIFFVIYSGLGGNFILFGGAMNSIDDSMLEAAKLDGAGPFRELISIIIPTIWPTLATMILMSSVGVFSASGPLLLFTRGDYGTNTLSFWIFSKTTGMGGEGVTTDNHYASAIGLIMTIVGLPIVIVVKKLTSITKGD